MALDCIWHWKLLQPYSLGSADTCKLSMGLSGCLLRNRHGHHSMSVLLLVNCNTSHPTGVLCLSWILRYWTMAFLPGSPGVSGNVGPSTCTHSWGTHGTGASNNTHHLVGNRGVSSRRSTSHGPLQHLTHMGHMGVRAVLRVQLTASMPDPCFHLPPMEEGEHWPIPPL